MIKTLSILFFAITSLNSISQNLTVDELLKLRQSEIGYVEEYLTSKGWSFLEAKEPTDERMGNATFTYKKNDYDDTAQSFLNFLYSSYSLRKRITIQVNKVEAYNSYISRIKSLGCKLVNSKIKEGDIVKIYRGPSTTFQITTSTVTNDFNSRKTVYHFLICDNDDYIENFLE